MSDNRWKLTRSNSELSIYGKKKEDQDVVMMKECGKQGWDICKLGSEQIGMSGIWAPGDCVDCMKSSYDIA
jgi:hypothetical protein